MGVRNLKLHNKSLLYKWHWRCNNGKEGLRKKVATVKYGLESSWCTKLVKEPYGVDLWRQITNCRDEFNVQYKSENCIWKNGQILGG